MPELPNLLVSAIIPTFNRAAFLAEAVASLRRQSYEPLEVIVVDDGSTDATCQLARGLKGDVRYLCQANRGPAAARNAGIKAAQGSVVAFLDADDLWVEDALARRMARLANPSDAEPNVEIVLGLTQRVDLTARDASIPPWAAMSFGSAVFQKTVFDTVGLLDESLRLGEDVDWFLRAREAGVRMAFIKYVTHLYRIHSDNLTNDEAARDLHLLNALKKSLDRRQRAGDGRIVEVAAPDLDEMLELLRPSLSRRPRAPKASDVRVEL